MHIDPRPHEPILNPEPETTRGDEADADVGSREPEPIRERGPLSPRSGESQPLPPAAELPARPASRMRTLRILRNFMED